METERELRFARLRALKQAKLGQLLSNREMELLFLLTKGRSHKQIAEHMGISAKTVEKHADSLRMKLDCHNGADLARWAFCSGLVMASDFPSVNPEHQLRVSAYRMSLLNT